MSTLHSFQHKNKVDEIFPYFGRGNETKRLINHIRIDPIIQNTRKRTTSPAKMVRKGGPWGASSLLTPPDLSLMESPSGGLDFDADTACHLSLICNFKTLFLNLNTRNKSWQTNSILSLVQPTNQAQEIVVDCTKY